MFKVVLIAYTDMLNQRNTVLGQANARNNHMAQNSHISKAVNVEKLETSFGTLVQVCLGTVEHSSFVTCVGIYQNCGWTEKHQTAVKSLLNKSVVHSSLTNRPAGISPAAQTDISAVVFAHKQDVPPSE